jgi:hypothetical protein
MSHHRYPICPISGKVRYGERKDTKLALRQASRDRSQARVNEVACSRREIRSYRCSGCSGWHLTSQPARPVRLIPVMKLAVRPAGPAAQLPRLVVAATALTTGTAA